MFWNCVVCNKDWGIDVFCVIDVGSCFFGGFGKICGIEDYVIGFKFF